MACTGALAWGWAVRREVYLTAEFGLGYALGIVGTAAMVLLLAYSLRKRMAALRSWGTAPRWLGVHMALGLVGPTAILFHSNFQLGSLNSTVALVCVLLVAASGVVGRLIYPKIHVGLTGRRADLRELREAVEAERAAVVTGGLAAGALEDEVKALERLALGGGRGVVAATWRLLQLRRRARALLAAAPQATRLRGYGEALHRVAAFRVYERLFALWHAFHLPICVLLFAAAGVHVIAVHMY